MEIVIQTHHAVISDHMRDRAVTAVTKLARRLSRPAAAIIRFEQDGPTRRVEIEMRAARRRSLIAEGSARFFGPALAAAIDRIEAQARQLKRPPKTSARSLVRA